MCDATQATHSLCLLIYQVMYNCVPLLRLLNVRNATSNVEVTSEAVTTAFAFLSENKMRIYGNLNLHCACKFYL